MVGAGLVLVSLALFGYDVKTEVKGFVMEDGRKNPHPKGSIQAARWAKSNPVIIEKMEAENLTNENENGTN